MSSYSSSIKALVYGRQIPKAGAPKQEPGKALLVDVPGSGLYFARHEVSMLEKLFPSLGLHPLRLAAEKDVILEHLRDCKVFHFASHGKSHPFEPSSSHLVLGAGGSLTVAHLRDCKLYEKPPFLAYLSACSTKANAAENLADEEIHLVSACQLAGFRHVVGTLWKVSDRDSVGVAEDLYGTIRDEGMTDDAICRGLHRATKRFRDRLVAGQEADEHHAPVDQHDLGDERRTTRDGDKESSKVTQGVDITAPGQHTEENKAGTLGHTVLASEIGDSCGGNTELQEVIVDRDGDVGNVDAGIDERGMDLEDVASMNPRPRNRLGWVPYIHFGV